MEACYPQQIRLVLNNPDWAQYSVQELAQIGLRGARGLRPGMRAVRKTHQAALQAGALEVRQQQQAAAERQANEQEVRQQEQSLLEEFF